MDKLVVIDKVIKILEREIELGTKASREAFDAATDEDAYSEGKYDTRSLEASYLAGGQAQIVKELGEALQGFSLLRAQHFIEPPSKQIGLGSLLEIERKGSTGWYLLGPGGGGLSLQVEDKEITVLTLHSPLGNAVVSKLEGDTADMPEGPATIRRVL
ncbi:MAG: transcription elongation factor GreAB [Verrucomicrobia bacterium]|nr:transcription elongation factor GreAB [Verrucomicrobiota bacterium]